MTTRKILCGWMSALALAPMACGAVGIYDDFPREVHVHERYVIYSHGLIVEGDDPRPVHPKFGIYDFPAIKTALFRNGGFNLIAHQRPKNTDIRSYVNTLESWVRRLIAAGVAPEHVTLVGFSRGAQLTAYASSRLRSLGIGTALMAVCSNGDIEWTPPVLLGGRVLSIYETTDVVGSCKKLAGRSQLMSFEEVAISTGKEHGAFFQPLPEWLVPLKQWIDRTNRSVVEPGNVSRPVAIPRSTQLTIHSKTLNRDYDLQVKLPPSYDSPAHASLRYPVLYLNDATYNFQVAAGITHLPMNAQTIENLILVGIGYSHESFGDESRIRDYTPTADPAFKKKTGGAAAYMTFVEREVIPFVESRFRADSRRRAYAGHSLGGLFGAYVLFNKPELFQYYILSSPSLWYDEHVIWKLEQTYAERRRDLPANVYVSVGSLEHPQSRGSRYEMVNDVRDFESRLAKRRYPSLRIRSLVVRGASHETAFPTALMNGILWHFARDRAIAYGY